MRDFGLGAAAPDDAATADQTDRADRIDQTERSDARSVLGDLFPESPAPTPRVPGRRLLSVAAQVVAVGLGVVLLLERVPGIPSWDTIYAEDYWEFFPQALQHRWEHLFVSFGGYEQLLPRVIALIATYFPLVDASRVFALGGALVAAGCGLFIFHSSAGHVRSPQLRAVLGVALVLLPIALMELVDSGVGSPWFLMPATFWALLWRPRTRAGMATAALVAFAAASSEVITALFLPIVVARLYVLRRPREHAVTAGWLAGCLVQVPLVVSGYLSDKSRLRRQPGSLEHSLAFYAHDILLPSFGWHLAFRLQSLAGRNGATAIAALVLAVIVATVFLTQRRNRPFVVTAVLIGFIIPVFSTFLTPNVTLYPPLVTVDIEPGSRYSVLPILLFEAIAVLGVDHLMRADNGRHRLRGMSLRPIVAALALIAVLGTSWVVDFRYATYRSNSNWNWAPIAAKWLRACESSQSGDIVVKTAILHWTLPCDHLH